MRSVGTRFRSGSGRSERFPSGAMSTKMLNRPCHRILVILVVCDGAVGPG
jgi:hypothetical protein